MPEAVGNVRLAMEIAAIQRLAGRLVAILQKCDPLSEPVHLTKTQAFVTAAAGATMRLLRVLVRTATHFYRPQAHEC